MKKSTILNVYYLIQLAIFTTLAFPLTILAFRYCYNIFIYLNILIINGLSKPHKLIHNSLLHKNLWDCHVNAWHSWFMKQAACTFNCMRYKPGKHLSNKYFTFNLNNVTIYLLNGRLYNPGCAVITHIMELSRWE